MVREDSTEPHVVSALSSRAAAIHESRQSDTNDDDDSQGDTHDDTELHPESIPLANEIPPPTDAPVQPDRVGKVAVSA